jgi:DNA-binding response OmpR family regulator
MHILIVDDDKNIRAMVRECLEQEGTSIDEATTGEQAIDKVDSTAKPYDVVLLDMKMPGMGGMQALRRMKISHPGLQVVMITAYGTVETAVEAIKLGAVDYLRKPFTPKEVRAIVEQVASRPNLVEGATGTDYTSIKASRDEMISAVKNLLVFGKSDEAMTLLQKVVGEKPDDPEAYNLLGLLMEVKGDMLAAQRMYRAALGLDPTYVPARENLANTTDMKYRSQNVQKIK